MTSVVLNVRVAARHDEAEGICTFELVSTDGRPLPSFSAGSHIDVNLPAGPGETGTITRQYSLCNDPGESHRYLIGVLKDPATRGGSKAMHERVKPGDLLQVSPPKNHFPLAHDAKKSLLLAGGIGVTPILCMAERLAMSGAEFEMHYCTRSKARTAFLGRIAASSFAPKVAFHFDDAADAGADASAGKLDVAALLASPQPGTHLYVCGPGGFMTAVLDAAKAAGWPAAQLHSEFFSADVVALDSDGGFEVKLASTGRVVVVKKNQTVVQALADAGVEVLTSCQQGVCGTCLTRVLDGEPDHRDMYLTPEEQAANDQFLPCCSRSKSAVLVLDL